MIYCKQQHHDDEEESKKKPTNIFASFSCINFHLLFVDVSEEKERKKNNSLLLVFFPHLYTYTTGYLLSPQRLSPTYQSLSCWDRRGPRHYCVRIVSKKRFCASKKNHNEVRNGVSAENLPPAGQHQKFFR